MCKPIWDAALAERFGLVTSQRLADELEEALLSKVPGFSKEDAARVKRTLLSLADVVDPERAEKVEAKIKGICEADPDDDHVIAVAIAGEADAIVSGDRDILRLREEPNVKRLLEALNLVLCRPLRILHPGEFLELLRQRGEAWP